MSNREDLSQEFAKLRSSIQAAITSFEAETGICVCDIKLRSDTEQFSSFVRPKAGGTRITFIELGAA